MWWYVRLLVRLRSLRNPPDTEAHLAAGVPSFQRSVCGSWRAVNRIGIHKKRATACAAALKLIRVGVLRPRVNQKFTLSIAPPTIWLLVEYQIVRFASPMASEAAMNGESLACSAKPQSKANLVVQAVKLSSSAR